jgi:hypothetical protein
MGFIENLSRVNQNHSYFAEILTFQCKFEKMLIKTTVMIES